MSKKMIAVRMEESAILEMKEKAKTAQISFSKFLERAGSVVKVEDIVLPPNYNGGVPTRNSN